MVLIQVGIDLSELIRLTLVPSATTGVDDSLVGIDLSELIRLKHPYLI